MSTKPTKTAEKTISLVVPASDVAADDTLTRAESLVKSLMEELEARIDDGDLTVREIREASEVVEKFCDLKVKIEKAKKAGAF